MESDPLADIFDGISVDKDARSTIAPSAHAGQADIDLVRLISRTILQLLSGVRKEAGLFGRFSNFLACNGRCLRTSDSLSHREAIDLVRRFVEKQALDAT